MCTDVTHFYVDIECHINLIGPTTPFGTPNVVGPVGLTWHPISMWK
jgi:hypothetical protein